ncbi:hypothetical protein [Spirosoma koreense]
MNYRLAKNLKYGFLILLSTLFVYACSNTAREVSLDRFKQLVKDKEVERITIVNGGLVKIWLTPEALANPKYNDVFTDKSEPETGEPHLELVIDSEPEFRTDLATLHPTFPIATEKRELFGSTKK